MMRMMTWKMQYCPVSISAGESNCLDEVADFLAAIAYISAPVVHTCAVRFRIVVST